MQDTVTVGLWSHLAGGKVRCPTQAPTKTSLHSLPSCLAMHCFLSWHWVLHNTKYNMKILLRDIWLQCDILSHFPVSRSNMCKCTHDMPYRNNKASLLEVFDQRNGVLFEVGQAAVDGLGVIVGSSLLLGSFLQPLLQTVVGAGQEHHQVGSADLPVGRERERGRVKHYSHCYTS